MVGEVGGPVGAGRVEVGSVRQDEAKEGADQQEHRHNARGGSVAA